MNYQQQSSAPTKGTCPACRSNELVPARDELAAAPNVERDDLLECLECGRFKRLEGY